jgi:hypothetical protein
VRPPFRGAPEAPRPAVGSPWRPHGLAVAMAGDDGAGEEPRTPSGPPAPVHVPYAKTDTDPDVVAAPPTRDVPRRRSRSPFWAAVRSHLWLVTIVVVLAGAAGTAYWALRVHQRIGETTLTRGIAEREHATTVRCVEQQSNGAVWACGLVYRAESVCLIANVNPAGDWSTKPGIDLCSHRPELTALLPAITPSAVEADMASQFSLDVSKCAKIPTRKVRWACLGPEGSSSSCLEVRIVPWTPWVTDSSAACSHVPALRKFLGKGP